MATPSRSFSAPHRERVLDENGFLSRSWEWFIRLVWERLEPLGSEKTIEIANNQSSAADVTGLIFRREFVTQATVEYLVQRVTTSTGATELIESGIFICAYRPSSESWDLDSVSGDAPDDSGVTFSITAAGQVQYTSSNITGTASISRLFYRARTMAGKNAQYSAVSVGAGR